MQCTCRWMFLGFLLATQALVGQTVPGPGQTNPPDSAAPPAKIQKQAVLPPMPSGPLSQMPMEQIPPTPSQVTFQGGLLEISAQNSTLGEILREVRKLTGATIDIPQGSNGANERVVTHLGPGAPRDVLDVLLHGSSFNYVMVGSSSDPGAVSSVLLSAKPSAAGESQTAANAVQNATFQNSVPNPGSVNVFQANGPHIGMPGMAPHPFNGQVVQPPANAQPAADADESSNDDQENAAEENADDQAQSAQSDATDANTVVQPTPDANQPNAGPRTPEQILEMLRRQQQPGGMVPAPQQPPPQPQE